MHSPDPSPPLTSQMQRRNYSTISEVSPLFCPIAIVGRRLTHTPNTIFFPPSKAAAMSITNLYRSSRSTSKRSYNSGYAAACADLLQMIQQGVSDSETPPTIGRVMDWVEARLEAVRAREEEEDEEDEENAGKKDKDAGGGGGQAAKLRTGSTLPRSSSAPAVPQQTPREQVRIRLSLHPSPPSCALLFAC
jgi:hypothetical protein